MTDRGDAITIVTGVAEHADPWHALSATAEAIAEIVAPVGKVTMTTTAESPAWDDTELLIMVVSGDLAEPPAPSRLLVDAVVEHVESGRPLVAVHSSVLAFRDDPRWREVLGGRWVPGESMHPQIGRALVQTTPAAELPTGLAGYPGDFVLYDERYSFLEISEDVAVIARHTDDGRVHPLAWGRAASARRGGVVYDGLGHGVESYASGEHAAWFAETAALQLKTSRAGRIS